MAKRELVHSVDLHSHCATPVVVCGYQKSGNPFEEIANALNVHADGGVLELKTPVRNEQLLLLKNQKTGEKLVCCVAAPGNSTVGTAGVKVRFLESSPSFWGFQFLANPSGTAAPVHEEYPQV